VNLGSAQVFDSGAQNGEFQAQNSRKRGHLAGSAGEAHVHVIGMGAMAGVVVDAGGSGGPDLSVPNDFLEPALSGNFDENSEDGPAPTIVSKTRGSTPRRKTLKKH
jgi:hypothetical protein